MELSITIRMDNSAFEIPGVEVARILRQLADEMDGASVADASCWDYPIVDANGNTVGRAETFTDRNEFRR